MAQAISSKPPQQPASRARRPMIIGLAVFAAIVVAVLLAAWLARKDIADNLIRDMLANSGLEASYTVEQIGPDKQVLTDIVIGDPATPDLTIARAELDIAPRFGMPDLLRISLVRPRLFGTYTGGQISFGSLDPLIFTGSDASFALPDLIVDVDDGRALIESDFGPVGIKFTGSGRLRDGFSGELAASAPQLQMDGCVAEKASLYGQIGVQAQRPTFSGPLRFAALSCSAGQVDVAGGAVHLALTADRDLAGIDGDASLRLGQLGHPAVRAGGIAGDGSFSWRSAALTARYDITASKVEADAASAGSVAVNGSLRAMRGYERLEAEGNLAAQSFNAGAGTADRLNNAAAAVQGTLLHPLITQFSHALQRQTSGAAISADFSARQDDGRLSLLVPRATMRSRSGETVLALSRFQLAMSEGAVPLVSGNFTSGGQGLPRLTGRMEQRSDGAAELRVQMPEYAAGGARLAMPEMAVLQSRSGAVGFSGRLLASGELPGGQAQGLAVPVSGTWSDRAGLALWPGCTDIRFDSLGMANLTFDRHSLTLCPPRGSSIVRFDGAGLRVAAGLTRLDVAGRLGETPVAISSGPIGFAWPGALSASNMTAEIGPAGSAVRLVLADVSAQLGDRLSGSFSGVDAILPAVPLDVLGASGNWSFADGQLLLADAAFSLEDRQQPERFRPLAARGASLTLEDNLIRVLAQLREPRTDQVIVQAGINHDLNGAAGQAELAFPDIEFGPAMQPVDLSPLALGVVANVVGRVQGQGQVVWDTETVSSTGRFTSAGLDLAAAFGPVKGASGTVEFTDLLGMTTAPRQIISLAAINPGIEVFDGAVAFQLNGGEVIDIQDARWPFLGGTLTMRPVTVRIGVEEQRAYILDIEGLDAARFVEHMELNNLGARGTFDGTIPVIFDADGNGRLEGGMLEARAPGGNVAYVGDLTYEDLSPMANFAFDALRSLDYRQMTIGMNGPLTGELVTSVRFDGVEQGQGTQRNFITRRLARLPIRFIVNVRAPFYKLMTSLRAMYDPAAVRDPRALGLLTDDGTVLRRWTEFDEVEARDAEAAEAAANSAANPATANRDEPDIQPSESERVP